MPVPSVADREHAHTARPEPVVLARETFVDVDVPVSMVSFPPCGHGVPRVDHEVHDDLLDLPRVRRDAAHDPWPAPGPDRHPRRSGAGASSRVEVTSVLRFSTTGCRTCLRLRSQRRHVIGKTLSGSRDRFGTLVAMAVEVAVRRSDDADVTGMDWLLRRARRRAPAGRGAGRSASPAEATRLVEKMVSRRPARSGRGDAEPRREGLSRSRTAPT